jgi:DNA-binding beta-propeller fold protein YncE
MKKLLSLYLLLSVSLAAQEVPRATELPSNPFAIKKTWFIGGVGQWDYLTMDPAARRLYIAHGAVVQVVDVETGTVTGEISGLREAHSIALDATGELGYISDGRANDVKVFDRRSLQIVASIPTVPSPRSLVFEPQTKLLFVVCNVLSAGNAADATDCRGPRPVVARGTGVRPSSAPATPVSSIAVIDTENRTALGEILLPGKLGFALGDGNGKVYINVTDRDEVYRLDAETLAVRLQERAQKAAQPQPNTAQPTTSVADPSVKPSPRSAVFAPAATLDWSGHVPDADVATFTLPRECQQPTSLAIDGQHMRLFAACGNWKLSVLNALTGQAITSLTTGPGTDAIGYDQGRGLIYVANGGGYGSLTVVSQDATTDSYAVTQQLPTSERARTLAVDDNSGEVYLVTDFRGADLTHQGGIGDLKTVPINGSFQVLDIGH